MKLGNTLLTSESSQVMDGICVTGEDKEGQVTPAIWQVSIRALHSHGRRRQATFVGSRVYSSEWGTFLHRETSW